MKFISSMKMLNPINDHKKDKVKNKELVAMSKEEVARKLGHF